LEPVPTTHPVRQFYFFFPAVFFFGFGPRFIGGTSQFGFLQFGQRTGLPETRFTQE
jgi:hypothetical protein